jgi:acyl-CoA dehydrogenase
MSDAVESPENRAFRAELRAWLQANISAAADPVEWHRRLVDGRWAVPSWPERWGGRAASLSQQIIYQLEMGAFDAPPPSNSIALFNIGPMLMAFGTPEQQERYLPRMVTAEEVWCQGFSEPGAGSDLAALQTRAEDHGDHWLVTGQKTWNTFGDEADLCLALCRTDREAPKHKGISALIIDMHAPGVEVRPLREITGDEGFNEIFFDEVKVPKSDIVGQPEAGWKVAMSTLLFERLGTMKLGVQLRQRLDQLIDFARERDRSDDPVVRDRLAGLAIQVDLMQLLTEQALDALQRDEDPGAALPLGKLQWAELMQSISEQALELAGPRAQLYRGSPHELPGSWQYHCLYSRMTTIGAGTTQVQKNIMAYRILGLPREATDTPSAGTLARGRPLTPERAGLRDTTRRFLGERCDTTYVRAMLDDVRGTTDEVWQGLAGLGLHGLLVAEEHGGLGLGYTDMAVVLEELGRAVHPGPFASSALAAVTLLNLVDDKDAQADLLPGLADGSTVGTVALTELDGGHDWRRVTARAERAGDGWVLHGSKCFVPDGAAADLLLVTAATAEGLGLFAVSSSEVEVTSLVTVDPSRKQAEIHLDGATARRIGGGGVEAVVAAAVDRIMAGLAMDAVGAAQQALELANDYAKVRVQFDRPIGSFQAVQHLLADMLRNVELARAGALHALVAADEVDPADGHRAAVMAKAFASDALYRVTADAIQVFGGIGFSWEHDAHLYYKRAMAMQHAFGGGLEQRAEYARLLLDG